MTVSFTRATKEFRRFMKMARKENEIQQIKLIRKTETLDVMDKIVGTVDVTYYNGYRDTDSGGNEYIKQTDCYILQVSLKNFQMFKLGEADVGNFVVYCEPTFSDISYNVTTPKTEDVIVFKDPCTHEEIRGFITGIPYEHVSHVKILLNKQEFN